MFDLWSCLRPENYDRLKGSQASGKTKDQTRVAHSCLRRSTPLISELKKVARLQQRLRCYILLGFARALSGRRASHSTLQLNSLQPPTFVRESCSGTCLRPRLLRQLLGCSKQDYIAEWLRPENAEGQLRGSGCNSGGLLEKMTRWVVATSLGDLHQNSSPASNFRDGRLSDRYWIH